MRLGERIEDADRWRVSQAAVQILEGAAKEGKSGEQTLLVEGPAGEIASYKYVVRVRVDVLELGDGKP